MILSISRRCDIPAFFGEWLVRRWEAGFLLVRNPFSYHQVSRIILTPQSITAMVFWSKNPAPFLPWWSELAQLPSYFQITLTPYGPELEPGLPDKERVILPAMRELAIRVGPERLVWRYDPLIFNEDYTIAFHLDKFRYLAEQLEGVTGHCVLSFLDMYPHLRRKRALSSVQSLDAGSQRELVSNLAAIASAHQMTISLCAEALPVEDPAVLRRGCICQELLELAAGRSLSLRPDRNQRRLCLCQAAVDIGRYDICPHECLYCYANRSHKDKLQALASLYDPHSPLLCDTLRPDDRVSLRQT